MASHNHHILGSPAVPPVKAGVARAGRPVGEDAGILRTLQTTVYSVAVGAVVQIKGTRQGVHLGRKVVAVVQEVDRCLGGSREYKMVVDIDKLPRVPANCNSNYR